MHPSVSPSWKLQFRTIFSSGNNHVEIFFEGISEMMDEREREDVLGVGCSPGRLTFLEKWLNYFWVYVPASSSRWNKLLSRWLFLSHTHTHTHTHTRSRIAGLLFLCVSQVYFFSIFIIHCYFHLPCSDFQVFLLVYRQRCSDFCFSSDLNRSFLFRKERSEERMR